MLHCPAKLHRIHRFEISGCRYVADINKHQCFEISEITDEILQRCESTHHDALIEMLSKRFHRPKVIETMEELGQIAELGFLFHDPKVSTMSPAKLRIFAPNAQSVLIDTKYLAGGGTIASNHLLRALARYADIVVPGSDRNIEDSGFINISLNLKEPEELKKHFLQNHYEGILLWSTEEFHRFRYTANIPIISRIYSPRGHNGILINRLLRTYAAMEEFDAFIAPTQSVIDFYSRFVLDTDCFHVVSNGVDIHHFRQIDQGSARKQVSQILKDPRIATSKPIIGFFSRFQPEKGAGVYIQLAKLLPEMLFLAIAPPSKGYSIDTFPQNLIYAGQQPREQLPVFINCFDIHCFPSMVGEESFSNAVRETMACGVIPIVPNMDGLPENVGEGGIVVECKNYKNEIGSFAASISPYQLAEAIKDILDQPEKMQQLSEQVLRKARSWTWDDAAKCLLDLFSQLNLRQEFQLTMKYPVRLVPYSDSATHQIKPCSILVNSDNRGRFPLMFHSYQQSMLDGVALKLLRKHTLHEVEAVLLEICESRQETLETLQRVRGFYYATS
jgi:glycosyltransferase involved in cell wall biosynthesis